MPSPRAVTNEPVEVDVAAEHASNSDVRGLVLVVDDRPDVAGALADLCRSLGVDAVTSGEGEPMRRMLLRHRPTAVVLDVMMPEEDGFEALKAISAVDPKLPVLLMTGHGDTWLEMGAILGRAHGLAHVRTAQKPVRREALTEFLEAAPMMRVP